MLRRGLERFNGALQRFHDSESWQWADERWAHPDMLEEHFVLEEDFGKIHRVVAPPSSRSA
jgi:hypothetical protein